MVDRVTVHWGSVLINKWFNDRLGFHVFPESDIAAQAYGRHIYMKAEKPTMVYDDSGIVDTLVHEIGHAIQYERLAGTEDWTKIFAMPEFGAAYFYQLGKHGYSNNDFEVEAREIEEEYGGTVYDRLWNVSVAASAAGLITTNGTQSDSQNQLFQWDVTGRLDASTVDVTVIGPTAGYYATNPAGSYDFNNHRPGTYTFTVTADNPCIEPVSTSVSVQVRDDDRVAPAIQLDGPSGDSYSDANPRVFSWNVADSSGLSSVVVDLSGPEVTPPSSWATGSTPATGLFDFTSNGPGYYTINVQATDNDNDWVGTRRRLPAPVFRVASGWRMTIRIHH